jgi:two-component system chemotaxis sensor kinase CheA
MTSQFEMAQYLGVFLDELEEQLREMDQAIILLERDSGDIKLLNRIFRAAHTIKGAAATMGFESMAALTHDMENILDKLRQKEMIVTREVANVLLACLDCLQAMKTEIAAGKSCQGDIQGITARLQQLLVPGEVPLSQTLYLAEKKATELNEIEENVVRAAQLKGYRTYHIEVILDRGCMMKAARAYIIFNNLKDAGEIIKTVPPAEDIEKEKFDYRLQMLLVTREDMDTVRNILNTVSEIESIKINPVELEDEGRVVRQAWEQDQQVEQKVELAMIEKKLGQTVRVDVKRLENLMNLVGELVIDRGRLAQVGLSLRSRLGAEELVETLDEVSVHIGRITGDLQEEIMKARMFPIEQVFNRFPRMVRDLSQKAAKEVEFIVEGRETELDRTVIEEIGDPLIHLLRNAIDHGIETPAERQKAGKPRMGTVKLKAVHQENQIIITVEDDGRGINARAIKEKALANGLISKETAAGLNEREILDLIFLPGFSTATTVSSVSGRGVGMDIVRSHIEKINGTVEIDTVIGRGTLFTIKLPLTLAICRSLLVYVGGRVFAFPLASVVEILELNRDSLQRIQRRFVALVRGEVLPVFRLDKVLGFRGAGETPEMFPVVVAGVSDRRLGFIVDALIGEQEIVIKSLGDYLGQVPGLAGATIMGDGQVALILDVRGLVGKAKGKASNELAG